MTESSPETVLTTKDVIARVTTHLSAGEVESAIAEAVREGRTVYDNIVKAILFILPTSLVEAAVLMMAIGTGIGSGAVPFWGTTITASTPRSRRRRTSTRSTRCSGSATTCTGTATTTRSRFPCRHRRLIPPRGWS